MTDASDPSHPRPETAGASSDPAGSADGLPTDQPDDRPEGPGTPIRAAAALVGLESLALVALAVAELVNVNADHPASGISQAVFFLLYAAGLALCARGLLRLSSWTRGPIVLAQLIELGVAWSFFGNDTVWVAVLLAVPAVVVLVVMFSPSTTHALYGHRLEASDYE